MNQLMRGVLYPAANVVFWAQADNPGEIKIGSDRDPNMSTDPLTSTFGGWTAVENAALALAESANLVAIEGRRCSTGVVAPTKDPVHRLSPQVPRPASPGGPLLPRGDEMTDVAAHAAGEPDRSAASLRYFRYFPTAASSSRARISATLAAPA
jgi:hypothetical protein